MGLACREIVNRLEEQYPSSCAEEWDNVGLLVGRMDQAVEKVYVALDLTEKVLGEALGWGGGFDSDPSPHDFRGCEKGK